MEPKGFKELIKRNLQNLQLTKYKSAYYAESEESIVFLILRRSGYSNKYYLRLKTEIKPLENSFDKEDFIKHDVSDILLSLDSKSPEIFDLENDLTDSERGKKMQDFFDHTVKKYIKTMLSKKSIHDKQKQENLVLLPSTKTKLGLN